MKVIFWCEFPEELDFTRLNNLIDFKTEIYFAASSLDQFKTIKKKVKNKNITVSAWPILAKKSGYWFSGFISKENIDKLNEFNGLKIKVDVEPPLYEGPHSMAKDFFWFLKYSIVNGKNNDYLNNQLKGINSKFISSGFLLPRFIRKRYGDYKDSGVKNYICYTTFFPRGVIRYLIRLALHRIVKRMNKDNFYAIGLANHGIFINEPEYESMNEFKKDIDLMKKAGVKNLCIYSIEGVLKHKDAGKWLLLVKSFVS